MNTAHLVWVATCVGLVFFMQAGFALVECGSARSKNAINVIMKNYTDMSVGALIFWAFGYGLMFGKSDGWIGLDGFFPAQLNSTDSVFMAFQIMFAATAVTIFSGAVAERIHYWSYLLFCVFATGIIYPIFGSWVWNANGWLASLGFIDFAGSTVVHSVGAWCALAGVIVIGPRLGRFSSNGETRDIPGHNLPYVALGGFILWMGWFGFNGGSISSMDDNLGLILLNTHLGGSAGAVGALLFMGLRHKAILMTATVNGSISGLVAITAGAATFSPLAAVITGLLGGLIYGVTNIMLEKFKLDDVVGAVSVHGFCGAWGTLAVAFFPSDGHFEPTQLLIQLLGIAVAFVWAFALSFLAFKLIDKVIGLRASTLHEQRGLDYTEHYELGYPEFQQSLNAGFSKE
ncbi:MAG: ammonium transporter [Gammaproteobacteria bacterium]